MSASVAMWWQHKSLPHGDPANFRHLLRCTRLETAALLLAYFIIHTAKYGNDVVTPKTIYSTQNTLLFLSGHTLWSNIVHIICVHIDNYINRYTKYYSKCSLFHILNNKVNVYFCVYLGQPSLSCWHTDWTNQLPSILCLNAL